MSEARKRRFVRVLALVVLLGAILPNVTYIGHWTIRGLETANAEASADSHANHCHGSSACADQAAYGLQWWTEAEDALNLNGGRERAQAPERDASPIEPIIAPLDPPPQYA
jgi:hypothetical protein